MGIGFSALRKANRATACEEATSYGTSLFVQTGPGGLALRNALIMEKIVSFLDDRELSCWYESCHTFRNIIEQMDEICWKGRVQKLATALHLNEEAWEQQQLLGNKFREMFYILLSKQIKSKLEGETYYQVTPPFLCEAARLAHQGLLGPLTSLYLEYVDLASVPTDHFCSLIASVTDVIKFGFRIKNIDLSLVLDHVSCRELEIWALRPKDTPALVRAMKSRVSIVGIDGDMGTGYSFDIEALTEYDGKGKCCKVVVSNHPMHIYLGNLKTWANRINWDFETNTRFCCEKWVTIQRKEKRKKSYFYNLFN